MIPEWSTNGDLPPGVHFATWQELEDRLSFNPRRLRMLAGFRQACEELRKAGADWLPGRQLCHSEGTSRRLRCLLGRAERGRRQARRSLLGFLPGPRRAEAPVPRRVVSCTTAGRRNRQGVCGFLSGE